jgi:hypothetical protein
MRAGNSNIDGVRVCSSSIETGARVCAAALNRGAGVQQQR